MKHILILLTFICSLPVFGQHHFIGFRGGVSLTNVHFSNNLIEGDFQRRFHGGISYEYRINKKFHLMCDLMYDQKGYSTEFRYTDVNGNPTDSVTARHNFEYISLPIKTGYRIGNQLSGFLNLGAVPAVLTNSTVLVPAVPGISEEERINATEDLRRFDLVGLVEIGGDYTLHDRFVIFASGTYTHSLISYVLGPGFEARHYGVMLSLGVRYALGGKK
ncbi:MAG: porin family protein [Bacteroidota bacterium]